MSERSRAVFGDDLNQFKTGAPARLLEQAVYFAATSKNPPTFVESRDNATSVRDMKYSVPTETLDSKFGESSGTAANMSSGDNLVDNLNQMGTTEKKATAFSARFSEGRLYGKS